MNPPIKKLSRDTAGHLTELTNGYIRDMISKESALKIPKALRTERQQRQLEAICLRLEKRAGTLMEYGIEIVL